VPDHGFRTEAPLDAQLRERVLDNEQRRLRERSLIELVRRFERSRTRIDCVAQITTEQRLENPRAFINMTPE
jgi:hypothetical protein